MATNLDEYRQRKRNRRLNRKRKVLVSCVFFLVFNVPQIFAGYGYLIEKINQFFQDNGAIERLQD